MTDDDKDEPLEEFQESTPVSQENNRRRSLASYQVIASILFCSFILTLFSRERDYTYGFLNVFLGYIFIFSAMMKMAHLLYFARHFSPRSFISRNWSLYAYVFPFIQLCFGVVLIDGSYIFLISFFILFLMGELLMATLGNIFLDCSRECKVNDPFLWPSIMLAESAFAIVMAILNIITAVHSW